jgi:hypothetical protein
MKMPNKNKILCQRALSPIFATMILAAIVISLGSVAYYYVNNVTTSTTNQLKDDIAASQESVSERITVENIKYTEPDLVSVPNKPGTMKIYVLNSGLSNDVRPTYVFVYKQDNTILGYFPTSSLYNIDTGIQISDGLVKGQEGFFTVSLVNEAGIILPKLSDSQYIIQLTTEKGSGYDYVFTP